MEGSGGLRFCPKYPELLPGFSTVDNILENAQNRFYALRLPGLESSVGTTDSNALIELSIEEARTHFPVSYLCSAYIPEEHRISATGKLSGHPVLTFANILKQPSFPLGQVFEDIEDIVYVDPEAFDPAKTRELAGQIGKLNRRIERTGRKYILIGPGRWGSADPWLGIPVKWKDISDAVIIIETVSEKIRAAPSQGTHFFHNITARGISYITIRPDSEDRINWEWFTTLPVVSETHFLRHLRAIPGPVIKIDGNLPGGGLFN